MELRSLIDDTCLWNMNCGWRRGLVVRTSVCSWQTFPDLRLIYG